MTTNLEPLWIVGFIDGEGSFNLDVHIEKTSRWGLQMQPEFTVVQEKIDIQLLNALKNYFGCGSVLQNPSDYTSTRMMYRCKNIQDLHTKIVPFFERHQLKSKKKIEFIRFRRIVRKMAEGYHNQSVHNFLTVVQMGEDLRIRQRPSRRQKRAKVDAKIQELRAMLETNPT